MPAWDDYKAEAADRKSVVQGKSVDLGGRRIIKKKSKKTMTLREESQNKE